MIFYRIQLFFLITISFYNALAQKDSTIYIGIGSYYIFYSDYTYKLVNKPCDICPNYADDNNIISYGTFVPHEDSAFLLTSSPILNPLYLQLDVEEKKINSPNISIMLDVPANKDKGNMLSPQYFYVIDVSFLKYSAPLCFGKDGNNSHAVDLYHKEYFQNDPDFSICCDSLSVPHSIKVTIYPKEMSSVSFAQGDYKIREVTNNSFIIHIPQFVTGFLDYKRMHNFVIERFDNGLIGDGYRTYVRKDIYEQENYSEWNFPVCPNWRYKIP